MRSLTLTAPPAIEPITLAEAKSHCRIDLTDDDELITALIVSARGAAEEAMGRALITQTWTLTLDAWPGPDAIRPPRPPLQAVNSIKYLDTAGSESTWSAAEYIVDTAAEPGRIVPTYGGTWPTADLYPVGAIRVDYDAGYGDAASAVPQTMRQALLLLIAHWYEQREETIGGGSSRALAEIPMGARALLNPYRMELV